MEKTSGVSFGCVCIPERHTDEYAQRRGKAAPGEHLNMLRKQQAGAEWFVSQAVCVIPAAGDNVASNRISTQAPMVRLADDPPRGTRGCLPRNAVQGRA